MNSLNDEMDFVRKIRIIENLKSQLLNQVAQLYEALVGDMKEERIRSVVDALSSMIIVCYILGRRVGIGYDIIEADMKNRIRLGLIENIEVERYYKDLTELSGHLDIFRTHK